MPKVDYHRRRRRERHRSVKTPGDITRDLKWSIEEFATDERDIRTKFKGYEIRLISSDGKGWTWTVRDKFGSQILGGNEYDGYEAKELQDAVYDAVKELIEEIRNRGE